MFEFFYGVATFSFSDVHWYRHRCCFDLIDKPKVFFIGHEVFGHFNNCTCKFKAFFAKQLGLYIQVLLILSCVPLFSCLVVPLGNWPRGLRKLLRAIELMNLRTHELMNYFPLLSMLTGLASLNSQSARRSWWGRAARWLRGERWIRWWGDGGVRGSARGSSWRCG